MPARQPSSSGRKPKHEKSTERSAEANPAAADATAAARAESADADIANMVAGTQPADAAAGNAAEDARLAADTEAAEDAEDQVPMNRAARRAKGKGNALPRPVGKIMPGRTNLNHGPRSYANRRTG